MTQYAAVFGVLAGVLTTLAYAPYIVDTIAGRTRPQRASWMIWSVLGSIALCSQIYEEAGASIWFAAAQVSGTILVLVLSFWFGRGTLLRLSDLAILAVAAFGLVLWYQTDNAAYALSITITISLLGGMLTAAKAYRDPDSETLGTWVISLVASGLAILSVDGLDPVLLAYPVYLFTLYAVFIAAIVLGRARNVWWAASKAR